jgi:hypothetical protein
MPQLYGIQEKNVRKICVRKALFPWWLLSFLSLPSSPLPSSPLPSSSLLSSPLLSPPLPSYPPIFLANSNATAVWDSSTHRRKMFEKYAREKGFDPLVAHKWYSQTRKSLLAFEV